MSFRTPKYRLHKGSGQALVQIEGQRMYLGRYGTQESKEKYRRLVAEFLAARAGGVRCRPVLGLRRVGHEVHGVLQRAAGQVRSEERRVGKEGRSRGAPDH